MNGAAYMAAGSVILLLSTAGVLILEWILWRKRKKIREQTYQIYEEADGIWK